MSQRPLRPIYEHPQAHETDDGTSEVMNEEKDILVLYRTRFSM